MCGEGDLMTVRQDDLPGTTAQNQLAAEVAPDPYANGPYAGLNGQRVGIKRTPRQPSRRRLGLQLWTLLHAQSLLDGPGSAADAFAFAEDDYRRLRTI